MANISTKSTSQPEAKIEYKRRKNLTNAQWDNLATNVREGVEAALAGRAVLNRNLAEWSDLYEMLTEEKDFPWPMAANLKTPLIATELEALVAYIAGQVLVPRLFLVSGLTAEAVPGASQVERYLNAETKRQRGDTTWFEEFVEWLHLSTRDGTGYIEALWKYKKTTLKIFQVQPQMAPDPDTGEMAPVLGPDGKPVQERIPQEVEDIHNDVEVQAVELRNIITIPAEATSIQDAAAVVKVEYLYEDRLMEMVKDGLLDAEEVELALSMVPAGTTELTSSEQPLNTYTAGDTISIGIGQGSQNSEFFKMRGPIEVFRVHSRQYDLDKDGTNEENVFWIHSTTWRMLGWTRYEYFNGLRPFFPFSPFSRPKRLIGFSLVGRLAGLQNENDALRNQRLDETTLRLSPPWIGKKGSALEDGDQTWGPREVWWTDNPTTDYQRLEMPPIPANAYSEAANIVQDAKEYVGLSNPMLGAQSSGRRSATEARMQQGAAMTRTGLLAMRYRMAIRPVINFIFALKKQYLTQDQSFTDQAGNFTLPLQVLNQDYQIDVAGASDPIDAQARRTETLAAYEVLSQNPIIMNDPMKVFALTRKLIESFDWGPEADKILGSEQDLLAKLQQAQQAQAAQQGAPGAPAQNAAPPGASPPPQPPGPPQQ